MLDGSHRQAETQVLLGGDYLPDPKVLLDIGLALVKRHRDLVVQGV
jgi:hypothetical protein